MDNDEKFCQILRRKGKPTVSDLPHAYIETYHVVKVPMIRYTLHLPSDGSFYTFKEEYEENTFDINTTPDITFGRYAPIPFLFPLPWLKTCNEYIGSLSLKQKLLLTSYTNTGDRLANKYLRVNSYDNSEFNTYVKHSCLEYLGNPLAFYPLYFELLNAVKGISIEDLQDPVKSEAISRMLLTDGGNSSMVMSIIDAYQYHGEYSMKTYEAVVKSVCFFQPYFIMQLAKSYARQLTDIINGAPPLPMDCILFRGIKTDEFLSEGNSNIFHNTSFMSTSLRFQSALEFIDVETYHDSPGEKVRAMHRACCVKEIHVPAGTKALWMECITYYTRERSEKQFGAHLNEQEILLPPGGRFEIKRTDDNLIINVNNNISNVINLDKNTFKIKVCDIQPEEDLEESKRRFKKIRFESWKIKLKLTVLQLLPPSTS